MPLSARHTSPTSQILPWSRRAAGSPVDGLQELLAPREVGFYLTDWSYLGTRRNLAKLISAVTKIPTAYIFGPLCSKPASLSACPGMSWLARRKTTRAEDMAYCALGLFDLNLPMLYGEGSKAFSRLQEEIIRVSDDMTVFCWAWSDKYSPPDWTSILAPSPAAFRESGMYTTDGTDSHTEPPYSGTNVGLKIRLPAVDTIDHPYIVLRASVENKPGSAVIIPLCRSQGSNSIWVRPPYPPSPVTLATGAIVPERKLFIRMRPDFYARRTLNPLLMSDAEMTSSHAVLPLFHACGYRKRVTVKFGAFKQAKGTFLLRRIRGSSLSLALISLRFFSKPPGNLRPSWSKPLSMFFAAKETAMGEYNFCYKVLSVPEPTPEDPEVLAEFAETIDNELVRPNTVEHRHLIKLATEAEEILLNSSGNMEPGHSGMARVELRIGRSREQFVDKRGVVVSLVHFMMHQALERSLGKAVD